MNDKDGKSTITASIIGGVFAVIAAIIGGVFLIINTMIDNNDKIIPTIVVTAIIPVVETNVPIENFEVSASKGWQATGIKVNSGDQLTITVVGGSWTYQKGKEPYNSGEGDPYYICADITLSSQCVEPMPNFPIGGLIGRIGDQKFWIGNEVTIIVKQSGTLQLRINDGDDGLYDNDGTLQIKVARN